MWKPSWAERATIWLAPFEPLAPFLAMAGLVGSLVPEFRQVSTLTFPGIDFRVIYVSEYLFAHGRDPYAVGQFKSVYRLAGFPVPDTLFGHMPVYPQFTFGLLLPLGWIPGPAALWVWLIVSALAMAFAIRSLVRLAERDLALPPSWRIGLVGLCGAAPLVAFGLQVGNVSVAASALCIVAVCELDLAPTLAAACLAVALLLKPHLALWVFVATACFFGRGGRKTVARALTAAALFASLILASLALRGDAVASTKTFLALLASEQASGSMSPANVEKLPVGAQITDLNMVTGYARLPLWVGTVLHAVAGCVAVGALAWTIRSQGGRPWAVEQRLGLTAALVAFGMIVGYHRTHDANVLLLLLPAVLARLNRNFLDPLPILILAAMLGLSVGPANGGMAPPASSLLAFVFYRQGPLAMVLVTLLLFFDMVVQAQRAPNRDLLTL